jgi:DNA-binding beta-propeller fold protein YncE
MLLTTGPAAVTYTPQFAIITSTGDNKVSSFAIQSDGALAPVSSVAGPLQPFSASIAAWNTQLLVASKGSAQNPSAYTLDLAGNLGTGSVFGSGAAGGGVLVDSSSWAFSADSANNLAYTYQPTSFGQWQVLAYNTGTSLVTGFATGSGPGPMATDPVGRYVFVGNQGDNTISVFQHFSSPELMGGSPYAVGAMPIALAVDRSGMYLYVICGDNTLKAYSIDTSNGASLTKVSSLTLGSTPTGVATEPSGRYVFVSDATGVEAFSANAGALLALAPAPAAAVTNALGVYAEPSGKFLYVTANGSPLGAVYGFAINNDGSLTAVSAAPVATPDQPSSMAFTAKIE